MKHAFQCRVVQRQAVQCRITQKDKFHLGSSFPCSNDLIQDSSVAVNVKGSLEFIPDQHGDVYARISPEGHVNLDGP